jgi:hypothetical protein
LTQKGESHFSSGAFCEGRKGDADTQLAEILTPISNGTWRATNDPVSGDLNPKKITLSPASTRYSRGRVNPNGQPLGECTTADYFDHWHGEFVHMLECTHPKTAMIWVDAKEDLLTFTSYPNAHWRQIWSISPLERVNRDIQRLADVFGDFLNPGALLRLTVTMLMEQHDD